MEQTGRARRLVRPESRVGQSSPAVKLADRAGQASQPVAIELIGPVWSSRSGHQCKNACDKDQIPDPGSRIPAPESWIPAPDPGSHIPNPRSQIRDPRNQIPDSRSQIPDPRSQSLGTPEGGSGGRGSGWEPGHTCHLLIVIIIII